MLALPPSFGQKRRQLRYLTRQPDLVHRDFAFAWSDARCRHPIQHFISCRFHQESHGRGGPVKRLWVIRAAAPASCSSGARAFAEVGPALRAPRPEGAAERRGSGASDIALGQMPSAGRRAKLADFTAERARMRPAVAHLRSARVAAERSAFGGKIRWRCAR